jgi:hypothetical protein
MPGLVEIVKDSKFGCRDAPLLHLSFRPYFTAFKQRSIFARTKYFDSFQPQVVSQSESQWRFGTDHNQINLLLYGPTGDALQIFRLKGNIFSNPAVPGLPGAQNS